MEYRKNRVQQTPSGIWLFNFKFDGVKYFQTHFDTQEQAEAALQLQYKVLNLTTTGQKRIKSEPQPKCTIDRRNPIVVERNISLMYNDKYKVELSSPKIIKTLDTLEQARDFRDAHKQLRKQRVIKIRKPNQTKQKKTVVVTSFAEKSVQAAQASSRKRELNKSIAELNNATRVLVEKSIPTIAELSWIAKTKAKPTKYYIEQLIAGAYRV